MLKFSSKSNTLNGVTVFEDHADPNQFWYLPGPVSLARRPEDGRAALSFIKYKPSAVEAGKGGGFLIFEADLHLEEKRRASIIDWIKATFSGATNPRLTAVAFDEGTVQCIALDFQGSGKSSVDPVVGDNRFRAVDKALGASTPSLYGDNSAAFSLSLSQEGARIIDEAFSKGTTPVGIIYNLKYTGIRPALDVTIEADFKRIYNSFSVSLEAEATTPYCILKGGIDAAFEKLRQDGAVKVNVVSYTTEGDKKEKEKWAMDLFKEQFMTDFFKPVLSPGKVINGLPAIEDKPSTPSSQPTAKPETKTTGDQVKEVVEAVKDLSKTGKEMAETTKPTDMLPLPKVALRLKEVHQDELKTQTIEYHNTDAVQRTYAPQGFFGLLLADLKDKEKYLLEVDLDDPFFRSFKVTVDQPPYYQEIGLTMSSVSLDYGDSSKAQEHKHADFIFDSQNKGQKVFEVYMNSKYDTTYSYRAKYHFDPGSDWAGERYSYDLPAVRTENRSLYLNPYESLAFKKVSVVPGRIDWGMVKSVDVKLQYKSASGWSADKTFHIVPESKEQVWKVRLSDPAARKYSYTVTYHLKDGLGRKADPVESEDSAISIDDPFSSKLDIVLEPLFDTSKVKMAYVDLEYSDPASYYERKERRKFTASSSNSIELPLTIMDPTKKTFKYRFTFVGTDNEVRKGNWVETDETIVLVSDDGI